MVDEYYDAIANGYDELHGEEQRRKLDFIKDRIESIAELREFMHNDYSLLDVGCGTGISTRYFDVKDREGVDPSQGLIRIAIKNDPKGKYIIAPAEAMPVLRQFDLVISLTALQNFTDIDKGLRKIKSAGKRFILTFLKRSPKREQIEKLIEKYFTVIKRFEEDKDIIYFCR